MTRSQLHRLLDRGPINPLVLLALSATLEGSLEEWILFRELAHIAETKVRKAVAS